MMRGSFPRRCGCAFAIVALSIVLIVVGIRRRATRRSTFSLSSRRRSSRSRPRRRAFPRAEVEALVTVPLENAMNGVPD